MMRIVKLVTFPIGSDRFPVVMGEPSRTLPGISANLFIRGLLNIPWILGPQLGIILIRDEGIQALCEVEGWSQLA